MSTAFICDRCGKVEKNGKPAVRVDISAEIDLGKLISHGQLFECCRDCAIAARAFFKGKS